VRSPATVVEPACANNAAVEAQKADEEAAAEPQGDAVTSTTAAAEDVETATDEETTTSTTAAPAPPAEAAAEDDVSAAATNLPDGAFFYDYTVSIPAGETRYLLVYWSLYTTIDGSIAAGPAFDTTPVAGSPLVEGLTQEELCRVVNWDFGSCLTFTG
jgi:hypothetical protein